MAQMVRDVMTKDPVSMSSDASVAEAAKAMSDLRIGSVVVMDKDRPCGIVSGERPGRVMKRHSTSPRPDWPRRVESVG